MKLQFVLQRDSVIIEEFSNFDFLINYFKEIGYNENKPFKINWTDFEVLANRCESVLDDIKYGPQLLPTDEVYNNEYLSKVERVYRFIIDRLLPTLEYLKPNENIYLK